MRILARRRQRPGLVGSGPLEATADAEVIVHWNGSLEQRAEDTASLVEKGQAQIRLGETSEVPGVLDGVLKLIDDDPTGEVAAAVADRLAALETECRRLDARAEQASGLLRSVLWVRYVAARAVKARHEEQLALLERLIVAVDSDDSFGPADHWRTEPRIETSRVLGVEGLGRIDDALAVLDELIGQLGAQRGSAGSAVRRARLDKCWQLYRADRFAEVLDASDAFLAAHGADDQLDARVDVAHTREFFCLALAELSQQETGTRDNSVVQSLDDLIAWVGGQPEPEFRRLLGRYLVNKMRWIEAPAALDVLEELVVVAVDLEDRRSVCEIGALVLEDVPWLLDADTADADRLQRVGAAFQKLAGGLGREDGDDAAEIRAGLLAGADIALRRTGE